MKFATSAESYNFYAGMPSNILEKRAKAIESEIADNVNADVEGLMREFEGIKAASEERDDSTNVENRSQMPPELRMTGGETEQVWDALAAPEYRTAFFKNMQRHGMTSADLNAFKQVEQRADQFNTLSNSAAVIPTTTLNQVIEKAKDRGGIINLVRQFSVESYVKVPVGVPIDRAEWHTEGAKVDSEKVDTTFVQFAATEVMKLVSTSKAANVMPIDAFESYLTDQLTDSVMAEIAYTLVWGTGEDEGQGIESIEWTEGENQLTVAKTKWLDWKKLLEAVAMLHRGYSRRASWVMSNKTLYTGVYGICDDNNRPLYLEDAKDGGNGRLLGFPVVVDDFMDDDEIIFGDWNYFGLNIPQSIQLDRSEHSNFDKALIDWRAFAIADSRVILPEAFVRVVKGQ